MAQDSKSPAIVPYGADQTVYLVVDSFGSRDRGLPRGRIRARRSRERDRRSAGGPLQQSRPADRLQHAGALDRRRLGAGRRRDPVALRHRRPARAGAPARISSMRMAGCPGSRRCGSRKRRRPQRLQRVFAPPNHRHAQISVSKLDSKTLSRTRHPRCDPCRQALVLALVLATPASSPSHGGPLAPHLAVLPRPRHPPP